VKWTAGERAGRQAGRRAGDVRQQRL